MKIFQKTNQQNHSHNIIVFVNFLVYWERKKNSIPFFIGKMGRKNMGARKTFCSDFLNEKKNSQRK